MTCLQSNVFSDTLTTCLFLSERTVVNDVLVFDYIMNDLRNE